MMYTEGWSKIAKKLGEFLWQTLEIDNEGVFFTSYQIVKNFPFFSNNI